MAAILVLVHEHDCFHERHFIVQGLFGHWIEAGHQVVVHAGTERLPSADVAFLHVDRSVVPAEYVEATRRYPRVINGATGDIRKRTFSEHLVTPGDGYRGDVILKTDLNAGGVPELVHAREAVRKGGAAHPPVRYILGRYRVLPAADVPARVFEDPDMVVEKFMPERDERGYYLRTWVFLGARERCNRVLGVHPVVKAEDSLERVPVPVPDELRAVRARLGFDYGKFDFAIHEGKPVLYDVNRTPSMPAKLAEAVAAGMKDLASGIEGYLPGGPRDESTSVGQRSPSS